MKNSLSRAEFELASLGKLNVAWLLENVKILKPMAGVFVRFLKVKRHPKWMDKVICQGNYLVIVL